VDRIPIIIPARVILPAGSLVVGLLAVEHLIEAATMQTIVPERGK